MSSSTISRSQSRSAGPTAGEAAKRLRASRRAARAPSGRSCRRRGVGSGVTRRRRGASSATPAGAGACCGCEGRARRTHSGKVSHTHTHSHVEHVFFSPYVTHQPAGCFRLVYTYHRIVPLDAFSHVRLISGSSFLDSDFFSIVVSRCTSDRKRSTSRHSTSHEASVSDGVGLATGQRPRSR